ncbi:TetR/AcrR family transcriptional regulator [Ferrimonas pelagia]|uniref:TetR/AcrR family transcriptional regulator n=1 Tax=Ferrimonas pelagia TaxID=1177826 RepID=A0ABP9FBF9_9GAMM
MGQGLSPRSEQKRQQIVQAASELFMQQGYLTTSMDEIAQQAGVSKQTVYAHFGSKDELFTYCVESKCVAAELQLDTLKGRDMRNVLTEFLLHFVDMIYSPEAIYVYRLCVSAAETHPQLSQRYFEAGPDRVHHHLANYLQQACIDGWIQLAEPEFAAEQLLLMARGLEHMRCELGLPCRETPQQRRLRIEQVLDLFLQGAQG